MGGAQAGEVASEIAVRQFERGLPDDRDPAGSLVGLIQAANARIHEESRADAQRAGMGTTLTAAYVAGDDVIVAHVGDSRCYLLRDGDLTRLTRDHSLVDELVRRGKLTEAQAEAHPQRSVITRALGAGADVEVDVEVFPARDGDLFLVCSDGLTGMVHEAQLKPLLEQPGSLERMGRSLIAAANEAGGRDNITVILFRLEDTDGAGAAGGDAATVESDAVATEPPRRRSTTRSPARRAAAPGREPAVRCAPSDETEAEYRRTGTVALQAIPGPEGGATAPAREPPPPRTAPLPGGERPRGAAGAAPAAARCCSCWASSCRC